ncbi:MAG TPA: PKD domain-containing protein [Candidatus Paceibacterota bacterium]|nr:PKD domain-containing protein [Candidatus Paceibacterota bacterium]
MQKYKSLIVGSLLALVVVSAPLVSFAKNDKKERDEDYKKVLKVEYKNDIKLKKNGNHGLMLGRMSGWFGGHMNAKVIKNNLIPKIFDIKTLTSINVGEKSAFIVKAFNPQKEDLKFTVNWGDNTTVSTEEVDSNEHFVQVETFTHTYASAGTYTATITVENKDGEKDSSTVKIVVSSTN